MVYLALDDSIHSDLYPRFLAVGTGSFALEPQVQTLGAGELVARSTLLRLPDNQVANAADEVLFVEAGTPLRRQLKLDIDKVRDWRHFSDRALDGLLNDLVIGLLRHSWQGV